MLGTGLNSATASDFENGVVPSGTVSFAAGETSKTITVNVRGDSVAENDETFTVVLSNPSDGVEITTTSATGTIHNDDALIALSTPSVSKSETNTGSVAYSFTVTRAGNVNQASTANWTVTGSGTNAATASDFAGGILPSGTVSFAAGQTTQTITVQVAGDSDVEANESFTLALSNASVGSSLDPTTATGTIVNDDASLSVAATSASMLEGNTGNTPFTFTVTRTGYVTQASTVSWSVTGSGTNQATADDFAVKALPSGTLSFGVGESSKTITIDVAGDNGQEANEGFAVTLSNASAGVSISNATATGLIRNDDASLSLAATSATKSEGNTGTTDYTFTVTRAGYLTQTTTVNWAVGGSGTNPASAADFLNGILPTGTVTFQSGESSKLITVKVTGDSGYETNEGFVVLLNSASAGATITQGTANGTIQNDDARLSIAATSATKAEGNSGLINYTFTVTRIGNTTQASTANWSVSGIGTNQADASDFANGILPSGTVSFASGDTSKTITVQARGDSAYELNETFAVTLSTPSVGTSLGTATASGMIQNDDASLSIAATSATKAEGNSGLTDFTFTVTRGGNITQASTANWAVSGSGTNKAVASDFENATLPTGTVSFAAGETRKTITIKVAGENLVEQDEGFTVTLSKASVGTSISTTSATGLILNDDATVSIAASSGTKLEGHAGSTPFTFTVTRSGYTTPAATVDWAVTGAGASQATAADFAGNALPTGTVSFGAGETSKTITVNVVGDTVVEPNGGFEVTLANPSAGITIGTASATGTIQNDDARLSIAASSGTKLEGNTSTTAFTFTVTRAGNITQASTASWSVTGTGSNPANGTDFTGGVLPMGTVSFASGETSKTITVNVNGDSTVELNEQFTVTLSAPSTGSVIGTATATGTIQADDVASTGGDQFQGGAGVDTFNGLDGNDVMIGGGGADRLTGGLGADLFKYLGLGDAPYFLVRSEKITDFSAAEGDRIDLSAIDAKSNTVFNDAFTYLGLADFSPTNATGQLIFDYDETLNLGGLFGSVNADATPELAIWLPGVSSLSASSLIL